MSFLNHTSFNVYFGLIHKESTFYTLLKHFLSFPSLLYVIYTRLPWLLYYPQVTIFYSNI